MRNFRFAMMVFGLIGLQGCASSGKPVKSIIEEVCEQYGPASRECRDYRKWYGY